MGAGRPTKRRRFEEPKPEPKPCHFFKIPLELRLAIYDYALSDVTITVEEQDSNIFNSGELDSEVEGLPARYVPKVENEYKVDMVMVGAPKVVPYKNTLGQTVSLMGMSSADPSLAGVSMDSGYASAGSSMYSIASTSTTSLPLSSIDDKLSNAPPITNISLLQINSQIRNEMLMQMRSRIAKQTTLYVTYPYGLLVLQHHYPALLQSAKHIVITGSYTSPEPASPSASSPKPPPDPTQLAATKALQRLTRTLYSSYRQVTPTEYYKRMQTLQMRIFYPDETRYSSVWGDADSPVVAAMQLIPAGYIETKTWRGRAGNAVTMKVRPPKLKSVRVKFEGYDKGKVGEVRETKWVRNFSSVFRRFRGPLGLALGQRAHWCGRAARREDFWEAAFGDEAAFEKEVPEERCWNKA
jgi:hypothetical protein